MELDAFNLLPGVAFVHEGLAHMAREVIRNSDHEFVVVITTERLMVLLDYNEQVTVLGMDPAAVEDERWAFEEANLGTSVPLGVVWARGHSR